MWRYCLALADDLTCEIENAYLTRGVPYSDGLLRTIDLHVRRGEKFNTRSGAPMNIERQFAAKTMEIIAIEENPALRFFFRFTIDGVFRMVRIHQLHTTLKRTFPNCLNRNRDIDAGKVVTLIKGSLPNAFDRIRYH